VSRFIREIRAGVAAAEAMDAGAAALATVRRARAALVVQAVEGDLELLGRWSPAPGPRRATGGPSGRAGEGVLVVALALEEAGVFMETPRDRVLNRTVRGLLAALRHLGFAAHYFGREWVSVDRRPAGLLGWTRASDGRVLFEAWLGASGPFVHDSQDRFLDKTPVTLAEAGTAPTASALAEACERGWPAEWTDGALDAPEPLPAYPPEGLRWSTPRAAPIGLVQAGLAIEAGIVRDAALAGDFFQDLDAPERLRTALVGGAPTPERLRDALNVTYGAGGAVIEGLRSLQPALDGFLELVGAS
jgi:hypothetical protein